MVKALNLIFLMLFSLGLACSSGISMNPSAHLITNAGVTTYSVTPGLYNTSVSALSCPATALQAIYTDYSSLPLATISCGQTISSSICTNDYKTEEIIPSIGHIDLSVIERTT